MSITLKTFLTPSLNFATGCIAGLTLSTLAYVIFGRRLVSIQIAAAALEKEKSSGIEKLTDMKEDEEDDEEEEDTSDEEDGEELGDEPYKMILVVNSSLKMGTGKICAQTCHGCLGAYRKAPADLVKIWSSQGQAKITLKGQDENDLRQVAKDAQKAGLPYYLVADAGRTQIAAGSITVCAVGPGPASQVDKVTGRFKLL